MVYQKSSEIDFYQTIFAFANTNILQRYWYVHVVFNEGLLIQLQTLGEMSALFIVTDVE